jgi:hypothetical protein
LATRDEAPLRVTAGSIEPLESHILSQLGVDSRTAARAQREPSPLREQRAPDVVHDPLWPWPLWGLPRGPG